MKLLLKYLKPYRAFIALTLAIKVFGTLIELAIPYILSHILDEVVPTERLDHILIWGGAMILCAVLAWISNVQANRMAAKTARNSTELMRHDLFEATMALTPRQIDRFTIPSLESRLTSDTYHVHQLVGMSMRMGVRAPILLLGGMIVTVTLDPILTLIMLAVIPFIGVVVFSVTKKGIPLFNKSQQSLDGMIRIVREDSQGIRVIKALSKTDYEKRKFDESNRTLMEDEKRASCTMAASNPIVTLLLNIGLVLVMLFGALLVQNDLTKPGKIIAFIQYFTLMSNAMLGITRIFVRYSKGAASANRIAEVINTKPDLSLRSSDEFPFRREDGYIVFDKVNFSYLGTKDNLHGLSFSLPRGGTLGVIGATGSGKTTLISLLMRMYDVDSGAIRIGGRDVRTLTHEELNTKFGVVMQNDFIYADTVAENIRFGRDISDDDIRRAAHLAQAAEYIEQYDDTYDHHIQSKGSNLSGGQRQRLLISRALAGKPEILILDDASSALDYKTDAALRRSIRENLDSVTTVVVAQRVSSVMFSDLIIVLDDGNVIGMGTHDELLESCEVYREISDSQIGGAILD